MLVHEENMLHVLYALRQLKLIQLCEVGTTIVSILLMRIKEK